MSTWRADLGFLSTDLQLEIMANEQSLYQLNGVAHTVGAITDEPSRCIYSVRRQQNVSMHYRIILYLERAGLYHFARLNSRWFWLDEPMVNAFIDRWRSETHTFHMPFARCTAAWVAYRWEGC
ncbi:hypothetical protein AHAS_Ahas18G0236700 [Arachis hypogaea]|uniref:Aminotransferase-like plant mobile domain-containing protein n=1 Tax=Arachis hypogaea TaxID=3818 RepID=A0A444XZ86_ARAHY|nr:hypothetical protein Ahy_B08g089950 [Arachis hypogaea]